MVMPSCSCTHYQSEDLHPPEFSAELMCLLRMMSKDCSPHRQSPPHQRTCSSPLQAKRITRQCRCKAFAKDRWKVWRTSQSYALSFASCSLAAARKPGQVTGKFKHCNSGCSFPFSAETKSPLPGERSRPSSAMSVNLRSGCVNFRSTNYLEGLVGDLVSRLITSITHIATPIIPIRNPVTKSP